MMGDTTPISDEAARALLVAWYGHTPVEGADFLPASYELARFALAAARPLLVSAEAERDGEADEIIADLRAEIAALDTAVPAERRADFMATVQRQMRIFVQAREDARQSRELVEGLRAELAGSQASALGLMRFAHTVSDLVGVRITETTAAEYLPMIVAAVAALRAAGGQEKPTEAQIANAAGWLMEQWDKQDRAAAPVGGQAEPSDAQIEAAAKALYEPRQGGWDPDWSKLTERGRSDWIEDARAALRAAAAVSGEQAQPDGGAQ